VVFSLLWIQTIRRPTTTPLCHLLTSNHVLPTTVPSLIYINKQCDHGSVNVIARYPCDMWFKFSIICGLSLIDLNIQIRWGNLNCCTCEMVIVTVCYAKGMNRHAHVFQKCVVVSCFTIISYIQNIVVFWFQVSTLYFVMWQTVLALITETERDNSGVWVLIPVTLSLHAKSISSSQSNRSVRYTCAPTLWQEIQRFVCSWHQNLALNPCGRLQISTVRFWLWYITCGIVYLIFPNAMLYFVLLILTYEDGQSP